jgi:hypothetical protein
LVFPQKRAKPSINWKSDGGPLFLLGLNDFESQDGLHLFEGEFVGCLVKTGYTLFIHSGWDITVGQLFRGKVTADIGANPYDFHFIHSFTLV